MKLLRSWVAAAAAVTMAGAAQAALIDRGGGMIYDTTRNLTWLADMNYAFTSGYAAANAGGTGSNEIQASGRMGWDAAVAWADQLVYGGFSDWRLPTLNPADSTGGELSGLFFTDLGIKRGESVLNPVGDTAEQIANLALFSNVQPLPYWSGTEYALGDGVWVFFAGFGSQLGGAGKDGASSFSVAVRTGDVAASVPAPQTLALALLALGATVVARRRR